MNIVCHFTFSRIRTCVIQKIFFVLTEKFAKHPKERHAGRSPTPCSIWDGENLSGRVSTPSRNRCNISRICQNLYRHLAPLPFYLKTTLWGKISSFRPISIPTSSGIPYGVGNGSQPFRNNIHR